MPTRHDAPILSPEDDTLDRSGFAGRVAASLFSETRTKESLAVALCGNWGEGKTSTKNLIRLAASAQAAASSKPSPSWVEFSPWQVTGLPAIETLFFEEIGNALGKAAGKGSPEMRERSWRRFGQSVQAVGTFAEYTGKAVGLVMPGATVIGDAIGSTAKKVAEVSDLAAKGAELSKRPESLSDQKQAMRALMLELASQIVVVIDDMDRLGDDEILLVLRLIKANADLPNLTYLLLFQRDVVERAITRRTGEDGASYLEKFVQVFLELPRPNADRIHQTVTDGLTDLVNRLAISWSRFDPERWANLWQPGLRYFFTTMRDAHRYLNVVEFRMAGLVTRGVPEVNIIDVFAMECVRLFEPEVHRSVLSQTELFLQLSKYKERDDRINDIDCVIAKARADRQDAVRAILSTVFPAVSGAYSNMSHDGSSLAKWESQARLCIDTTFQKFYSGELGDSSVSEADIAEVLAVMHDRKKCLRLIRQQLKRSQSALTFLRRIAKEACFEKAEACQGLRLAIWDASDEFPTNSKVSRFDVGDASSIPYWTLADALKRINDIEARRRLIMETMFESQGVFAFVWVADGCDTRHEKVHFWPQLSEAEVARINTEGVRRLTTLAQSGKMIRSSHLSTFLWSWLRLDPSGVQQQVQVWLETARRTDVLSLLRAFVSRGSSWGMDSYYTKEHIKIVWNNLEEFAPFEEWKSAVRKAAGRSTDRNQPEEISLFYRAEKRRAAGKSDRGGRLSDDEDDEDDCA